MRLDSAFKIGKVFGIQLRLHYSWFVIFGFITIALVYPEWTSIVSWMTGMAASLLFFSSVVAHELAHSLVGRANGIPIKSITLFIFGGMAQMTREAARPGAELKMAVAGPACSLLIGALFGLLWLFTMGTVVYASVLVQWLALMNVSLAVFNLIPGFPLDGGRVFRSLLWRFTGSYENSTRIASLLGRIIGFVFILSGILIIFLRPFGLNWFAGIWPAFIGWFLENAASSSYRQVKWREGLKGFNAAQLMTTCPQISSGITIEQLIQEYILNGNQRFFLVADGGELKGVLSLHNIKSIPRQDRGKTQVSQATIPLDRLKMAYPGQDALSILEQMDESNLSLMPVISDCRVIGLITRDTLIDFLRIRSELGI